MHDYKKLGVWKDSIDLVERIYLLVKSFPDNERYGLTAQLTRASVSIPSNIAEGAGKSSDKEFQHFISHALGSCFEVETQIIIAARLKYINEIESQETIDMIDKIQKKLYRLKNSFIKFIDKT
jgi:four helix bundle protein